MKTTLSTIYNIAPHIQNCLVEKMPPVTAVKFLELVDELNPHIKHIEEVRKRPGITQEEMDELSVHEIEIKSSLKPEEITFSITPIAFKFIKDLSKE